MTRIVAIVAGLSHPSSSLALAEEIAASAKARVEAAGVAAEVHVVEIRPLAHELAECLLTGRPSGELARVLESVRAAGAVIAVTPIYAGSFSGLFKTFIDVLDRDALRGTAVLIGATAGTPRHSLALEHALRPIFSFMRAVVVPTAIFAAPEDFPSRDLSIRIDRAAEELAELVVRMGCTSQHPRLHSDG